jgi:nucleoside-diphosphate-sugar epimerase
MKISILGCGWLGSPLAVHLKNKGFEVLGSTTSKEKIETLKKTGVSPYLISISEEKITGNISEFLNTDVLFINIPFGKQKGNFKAYLELVKAIDKSTVQKIIFISSTAVYKDTNGIVVENENFEINPAKEELVKLENLFFNQTTFKTTVLRFSGLVGGARNPGNFFKPDRIVQNGLAPINLIHLDDCIAIVENIIQKNIWNEVFNASADTHPTRKEFYTAATIHQKKEPATFIENEDFSFKIISNTKLKETLNYQFIHPDLLIMIAHF